MLNRYTVVGAGGTGTQLLTSLIPYLRTYHQDNKFTVGVIDGDKVEEKNLSRQLFHPASVQMNKARAAVTAFDGMKNIIAVPEYLGDSNVDRFITEGSVVLICVDNFPVRAKIEQFCHTLENVVVINGGNEEDTGSCQIWVRENGINVTPPLSFLHPEINSEGIDRSELSCQEVAALPGGEQLIIANMASALWMLTALMDYHRSKIPWTELHFDLASGITQGFDNRERKGWIRQ